MPDDVIKAVTNLVTKFPTTDFKAFALEREGGGLPAEER